MLWSVHAVVSARAHGSALYSYGFFLQVDALRTVSTRQNKECLTERIDNGTPAVLSARAICLMLFFGDYCKSRKFGIFGTASKLLNLIAT